MNRDKELEKMQEELEVLQKKYDVLLAAINNLPNPIFMKDEGAKFVYFNKAYADFFNMRRRDYIGKTVLDLEYLPEEDRKRFQEEDLKRIENADVISYNTSFPTDDGEERPSFYWSSGFHDERTGVRGLVGEIVDITSERALQKQLDESLAELKEVNKRLVEMAETDAASGLYNRTVLWDRGKGLVEEEGRADSNSCMVMFDLDHFKEVNDEFGHLTGDAAVVKFAQILKGECRKNDLPIRYGGDEFLLILRDINLEGGKKVAERIRKRCEEELTLPNGKPITVSTGVIQVDFENGFEKNLSRLDNYLYEAKTQGRNRVVGG